MSRKWSAPFAAIALASLIVTGAAAQIYGNYSRTMIAGGTLLLAHFASVQADCSSRGPVTVRIASAPTSGAIRIKQGLGYSHFGLEYQQCSARKVFGASASYTPQRGFVGADSVQLDVIYPSGLERVESFAITVK